MLIIRTIKKAKLAAESFSLILVISCTFSSCVGQKQANQPKQNGISFVAPINEITSEPIEEMVSQTQSNSIAIMPFAFCYGKEKPSVIYGHKNQWWGEQPVGVIKSIQLAKRENLAILLKPQLWLMGGVYTGNFDLETDENWLIFEETYKDFIITFAKIAESEQVEIFCIGTELKLFVENRPFFWKNLIDTIKTIYNGDLTYAANWDDYKSVQFWSQLDYIGIDAYFPLSEEKSPSKLQLLSSWETHQNELKNYSKELGKKIVFTEFGYRSIDYSLSRPWESSTEHPINLSNQEKGLDAFFETFWNQDYVAGGYLWKWFDENNKAGGTEDSGYTPQNKPALKTIKKWYNSEN